jgi:hypothetical protein
MLGAFVVCFSGSLLFALKCGDFTQSAKVSVSLAKLRGKKRLD